MKLLSIFDFSARRRTHHSQRRRGGRGDFAFRDAGRGEALSLKERQATEAVCPNCKNLCKLTEPRCKKGVAYAERMNVTS